MVETFVAGYKMTKRRQRYVCDRCLPSTSTVTTALKIRASNFYNVRVPEPVAAAIHAGIHVAFNTAEMPSASSVKMKICDCFSFNQLLEWVMQRKKHPVCRFTPKSRALVHQVCNRSTQLTSAHLCLSAFEHHSRLCSTVNVQSWGAAVTWRAQNWSSSSCSLTFQPLQLSLLLCLHQRALAVPVWHKQIFNCVKITGVSQVTLILCEKPKLLVQFLPTLPPPPPPPVDNI